MVMGGYDVAKRKSCSRRFNGQPKPTPRIIAYVFSECVFLLTDYRVTLTETFSAS
jgi:hypothetical protein